MLTLFILTILGIGIRSTTGLQITSIPGPPPNLTDSIFWSDHDQSVYYADYNTTGNAPSIFRYDYLKQKLYGAYIEGKTEIAYLIPVNQCGKFKGTNNNLFLSGAQHDNFLIKWNGVEPKATVIDTVFRTEADIPSSHVDLGVQNHHGKFIGGTTHNEYCLGPANSSLYSYTKTSGVQKIYTGFQSTAGLAFYGNKIYHNDVCRQKIEELQQDIFGNYASKLVFDFKTSSPPILPSGLEADNLGNLYVVGYGSGSVWQIDSRTSTAKIIATLPSLYLTGVAFGGPKRDILFVVTSSKLFNATLDVVNYTPAPPLYMIEGLNVTGIKTPKLSC